MSNPKEKIGLKATSIQFTNFSIVYGVEFVGQHKTFSEVTGGIAIANNDIANKDLILKPTYVGKGTMNVIFTPGNVTPHFYQSILNGTIRNAPEYEIEKGHIYRIGEIVGFVMV